MENKINEFTKEKNENIKKNIKKVLKISFADLAIILTQLGLWVFIGINNQNSFSLFWSLVITISNVILIGMAVKIIIRIIKGIFDLIFINRISNILNGGDDGNKGSEV